MPRIRCLGQLWNVSSDDFALPCCSVTIIDVLFLTTHIVTVFVQDVSWSGCPLLEMYWIVSICLRGSSIVADIAISYTSLQGTILNDRARARVPRLVAGRILLGVLNMGVLGVGTYQVFGETKTSECVHYETLTMMRVVVCLHWAFVLVAGCCGFCLITGEAGDEEEHRQYWKKGCERLCFMASSDADSLEVAGLIMSQLFGRANVSPSDILTGFMLVKVIQHEQRGAPEHKHYWDSLPLLKPSVPQDYQIMMDVFHFYDFAYAVYGWPLYVYTFPLRVPSLCCSSCCCLPCTCCKPSRRRNPHFPVHGDLSSCNMAALEKVLKKEREYIYVSFVNEIFLPAHFVLVDRERHCVVIAVRGTLSFTDCLTDVMALPQDLSIDGYPGHYGHAGMVKSARNVITSIEAHCDFSKLLGPNGRLEGYRIELAGHSLGAGTATMVALLLRKRLPDSIRIHCHAYAPPGGLLSQELAEWTETSGLVTSVVIGDDMIPRTAMHTLQKLKNDVLRALSASTQSKRAVWSDRRTGSFHSKKGGRRDRKGKQLVDAAKFQEFEENNTIHPLLDSASDSCGVSSSDERRRLLSDVEAGALQFTRGAVLMCPPGRILHIRREPKDNKEDRPWRQFRLPTWTSWRDYQEILVGKAMARDHMPDEMLKLFNVMEEKPVWKIPPASGGRSADVDLETGGGDVLAARTLSTNS